MRHKTKDEKHDEEKANVEAFLKSLTRLSAKHRLVIDGCGCCGSPFLTKIKGTNNSNSYEVDNNLNNIKWR